MIALTIVDGDDSWECRPNGSPIGREVIGEVGTRSLGEVGTSVPNAIKKTSLFCGFGLLSQMFRMI